MLLYSFSIYQRRLYRRQNVSDSPGPTLRFVAKTAVLSPTVIGLLVDLTLQKVHFGDIPTKHTMC